MTDRRHSRGPRHAAPRARQARSSKTFVRGAAKASAVLAVGALTLVVVVDPYSGNSSSALVSYAYAEDAAPVSQTLTIGSTAAIAGAKDSITYSYTAPVVVEDDHGGASSDSASDGTSVSVDVPSPGSAQAIAYSMVKAHGWSASEYQCLVDLWNRESGWNVTAANPSGAYGIPQALPGSKMATAGPDWQTNARTQITWGLSYITGRYGAPCGAWAHSNSYNWY